MGVMVTERPSCRCGTMRVWSAHAVDNPKASDRSAEHAVPADRCAPEIVGFLMAFLGALAAADAQSVRRLINSALFVKYLTSDRLILLRDP
jgi:hypothetical protein